MVLGVALTPSGAVAKRESCRFNLSGAEEKQRRVTLLCQIFRSTKGETKRKREKKKKEAGVTPQNDGAGTLTATRRKHVKALTDACYIEQR